MAKFVSFFVCASILLYSAFKVNSIENYKFQVPKELSEGSAETSAEIAKLVSKTFSQKSQEPKPISTPNMLSGLFNVIGLDEMKLGSLAVNSAVFISQMVRSGLQLVAQLAMTKIWEWYVIARFIRDKMTEPQSHLSHPKPYAFTLNNEPYFEKVLSSFTNTEEPKSKLSTLPNGKILEWIIENRHHSKLFANEFHNLFDDTFIQNIFTLLIDSINQGKRGDCIRQLLCKLQSVFQKMQHQILQGSSDTDINRTNARDAIKTYTKIFSKSDFMTKKLSCEATYNGC